MKITIVIAILFGTYCTSSALGNYCAINKRITTTEDTTYLNPVIQVLLEYPVDRKKLDSLNIRTSILEIEPTGFGVKHIFELNNQELGECNGRRIGHRDSTWSFGMSNWQFESFITSSPKLPLLFGLTVGNNVSEISSLLGEPDDSNENEIIYDYQKESGMRLKIVLKDNLIMKVEIKKNVTIRQKDTTNSK